MKYILFSNCIMMNNTLFCVEAYSGLLIMADPDDGKIEYCEVIEGVIPEKARVIDFMDSFQEKIYALDSAGKNLIIFDLGRHSCAYVPLGCAHELQINFSAFERYGSHYYIFPKYDNEIFKFSTEENVIKKTGRYFEGMEEVQCACRVENDVWILPKDARKIYRYCLPDMEMKVYELGMMLQDCVHAIFEHGCIYILQKYGIVYKWNMEKEQLQKITVLETKHDEKESMSRILCAGNKLILLPAYGSDIKILDMTTKMTEVYNDYPEDLFYYKTEWLKYYGYCEDEKYYYFAMCAANYILMIKKQSGELVWRKPILDSLGEKAVQLLNKLGKNLFYEGSLEITDLLKTKTIVLRPKAGSDVGRVIYEKG